jgi:hypothetical protein
MGKGLQSPHRKERNFTKDIGIGEPFGHGKEPSGSIEGGEFLG